jgi:hypothetical protein
LRTVISICTYKARRPQARLSGHLRAPARRSSNWIMPKDDSSCARTRSIGADPATAWCTSSPAAQLRRSLNP